MTDTIANPVTTESRPLPCGVRVLLSGAGVVAAGGLVALLVDHGPVILNAIFLAMTFGHFWIGVSVHLTAAMLWVYIVCRLASGTAGGRLVGPLLFALAVYLASLFSVTDIAVHLPALSAYHTTALWIMWLGLLAALIAAWASICE